MSEKEYKTNSRKRILNYLMANSHKSLSVKDIDFHLSEHDSPVNITTIYRYLDKLENDGHLIKYTSQKGESTYQYVEPGKNCNDHLHLKCTSCGNVIHLDCHFMEEIAHHIAQDHGFAVECRSSVIYGVCQNCQGK